MFCGVSDGLTEQSPVRKGPVCQEQPKVTTTTSSVHSHRLSPFQASAPEISNTAGERRAQHHRSYQQTHPRVAQGRYKGHQRRAVSDQAILVALGKEPLS